MSNEPDSRPRVPRWVAGTARITVQSLAHLGWVLNGCMWMFPFVPPPISPPYDRNAGDRDQSLGPMP